MMNTTIDGYLLDGCMRCPLGGTINCKVKPWVQEVEALRAIILESGLEETVKWGVPCYTHNGKNVILLSAFKEYAAISFFKGALLADPNNQLESPGPNSQASRLLKFTSVEQVEQSADSIKKFLEQAIENEKNGRKVEFVSNPEPIPEELLHKFDEDPSLKNAFEALTAGRQRSYILHFSAPKKPETRHSRIEKCIPMILNGIGLHDKYNRRG